MQENNTVLLLHRCCYVKYGTMRPGGSGFAAAASCKPLVGPASCIMAPRQMKLSSLKCVLHSLAALSKQQLLQLTASIILQLLSKLF